MNDQHPTTAWTSPTLRGSMLRSPSLMIGSVAGVIATGLIAFALTQNASSAAARSELASIEAERAELVATVEISTRSAESLRAESQRYEADIRDAEAARASALAAAARRAEIAADRRAAGGTGDARRDVAEQFIRTWVQESAKESYQGIGRDLVDHTSRAYVDLFPTDPIAALESVFAGTASSMDLSERALLHAEREHAAIATSSAAEPNDGEAIVAALPGDDAPSRTKQTPSSSSDADTKAASQEFHSLRKLAIAQHRDGKLDEAMATCRTALDLLPKMNQKTRPPTESDLLSLMGRWQRDAGNLREALVLAHGAFSVQRAATTKVDAYAAKANEVARLHLALGDAEPALTLIDPNLAELAADEKPDSGGDMLDALILKAHASRLLGKSDEEGKAYERILGAYWYETQRYGVFDHPDWVNYLIARGEVERAELTLWAIVRRGFQRGSKVNFAAQVERLADVTEGKGDASRAAIYRRAANRLKKASPASSDDSDGSND